MPLALRAWLTKAAVSARQPDPEHDRQASDLVFQTEPTLVRVDFLVELRGFEPVISAMRHPRALDGVPLPTAMAFLRSCANTGAGTIDRTP
jgi:hypothetical protein